MKMLRQQCQVPYLIASMSISFIHLIFIKYVIFGHRGHKTGARTIPKLYDKHMIISILYVLIEHES